MIVAHRLRGIFGIVWGELFLWQCLKSLLWISLALIRVVIKLVLKATIKTTFSLQNLAWLQDTRLHGNIKYTKIAFVITPDFLQRVATLVASAKSSPRLAQYLAKGGETPFAVVPVRTHFNHSSHTLKNHQFEYCFKVYRYQTQVLLVFTT